MPAQPSGESAAITFIFAGGGTGGHLYPGLAIVEALRAQWGQASALSGANASLRCVFLCSDRPLDRKILEKAGVEFEASPARPIALSLKGLFRFITHLGPSIRHARRIIRSSRAAAGVRKTSSVHLVAMGGFVAAPAARAARIESVPLTLVNLDAIPGKANRWIGRRADQVISAMALRSAGAHDFPRAVKRGVYSFVPPIVRSGAVNRRTREECLRALGLDPSRRTLMVTGGSQGARSLNGFVTGFFTDPARASLRAKWQIIHQTGVGEVADVRAAYERCGARALVTEFVDDMATWWGAADLTIARAGAGNVLEAWANSTPCFFMPYPFHHDEHQRHNALPLVEAGAAVLAKDHVDAAKNLFEHSEKLAALMTGEDLKAMCAAFKALGPANGAEQVAGVLISSVLTDRARGRL